MLIHTSSDPIFFQAYCGVGTPSAKQSNESESPALTVEPGYPRISSITGSIST